MARTERPYEVFCGIDVGKTNHHACALDLDGRRLHDRALSNDETELRTVFTKLRTYGRVLVVIEPPWVWWRLSTLEARVAPCRKTPRASSRRGGTGEQEKEAAVRMVRALRAELGTEHGTVQRVARQLGYGSESVRAWVRGRHRRRLRPRREHRRSGPDAGAGAGESGASPGE